eukprot:COSAG01_NODE_34_length_34978_cov_45.798475_11_plen_290_part_00
MAQAQKSRRAQLRLAGNEHFRSARFTEALQCYTEAIGLPPSADDDDTHVLQANRSAAHHALGQLALALQAGKDATVLAPTYAKGYLRVANAHEGLEQWAEAIQACTTVARLDPSQAGPMERRLEGLHRRLDPACWRISRFSEVVASHMQGQTLESKVFHLQGHKWRFTLNPCGKSSHPDGVSLYLRYMGGSSVTATYTLAVDLSNGERLGTHTCSKRFERDTTWGSLNIVERDVALERSKADDTLIVRLCDLHIIDTKASTSGMHKLAYGLLCSLSPPPSLQFLPPSPH